MPIWCQVLSQESWALQGVQVWSEFPVIKSNPKIRHPDREKPQSAKRKRNEEESVHTHKQTKAAKVDEDHKAASTCGAVEKKPAKTTNKKGKEKAKHNDSNDQKKLKTLRVV